MVIIGWGLKSVKRENRCMREFCGLKKRRRMEGKKREVEEEMGCCEELKAHMREERRSKYNYPSGFRLGAIFWKAMS